MATSSLRPCTYPGCKALQHGSRCDAHKYQERRNLDKTRPSPRARGYDSRWEKYSKTYLEKNRECRAQVVNVCTGMAMVVDHIKPHKGDMVLFWNPSNHQPLCKACHDYKTANEDSRWGARPISSSMLPAGMKQPIVPLVVVCGPPGAGKSTLVKKWAEPKDLILDLDMLLVDVTGRPLHSAASEAEWTEAKQLRNKKLYELCRRARWPRAWLIASAPRLHDRRYWREHGAQVVLLLPSMDSCISRIRNDMDRPDKDRHEQACVDWWKLYVSSLEDDVISSADTFQFWSNGIQLPKGNVHSKIVSTRGAGQVGESSSHPKIRW